jgi:hypothetical protein
MDKMATTRSMHEGQGCRRMRVWSSWALVLAGVGGSALANVGSEPNADRPPGQVHLLVTGHCSATLITSRAAVTSAACVLREADPTQAPTLRVNFRQVVDAQGRLVPGRVIPFMPDANTSANRALTGVGDLALVLFDEPFPVASRVAPAGAIPTYWSESMVMTSPEGRRTGYLGGALPDEMRERLASAKVYTRDVPSWPDPPPVLMDTSVSVLRSLPVAQSQDPSVYGTALADLVEADLGMRLSDEELADLVMPAPSVLGFAGPLGPRLTRAGEWGAGLFARDGGRERLVGLVGQGPYQIRLSNYWPWIFKMLLKNDRMEEALAIADRVLGTPPGRTLTDTGQCTRVGQLYGNAAAVDVANGTLPFFRLMRHPTRRAPDGEQFIDACASFARAGAQSSGWEPMGTSLPSATEGSRIIFSWFHHGGSHWARTSFVGGYYGNLDLIGLRREFFRLKSTRPNGRLGQVPRGGRSNAHWDYVGEQLPAVRQMRLLEAPAVAR